MHQLRRRQLLHAGMDDVFAFFEDPHNLEAITPPWLHFRVLSSSTPRVQLGTRLAYRLRLHGLPLRWESLIAEYVPGARFADVMQRGPYRSWYHRHLFRAVPSGVEMEDIVDYSLPLGPLGTLTHALVVRHQLRAIFDYRAARIAERFGERLGERLGSRVGAPAHPSFGGETRA